MAIHSLINWIIVVSTMGGVYVTLWIGLIFSPITSALKGMSCLDRKSVV